MLIHFAAVSSHLYFVQNAINSSWASLLSRLQGLLQCKS